MLKRESVSGGAGEDESSLVYPLRFHLCPHTTQDTLLPAFDVATVFTTQFSPGLKGENG